MSDKGLLDEVQANIDRPIGFVTFTPALEAHYRTVTAPGRRRTALMAGAIGLVILQWFTLAAVLTLQPGPLWTKLPIFFGIDVFVVAVLIVVAFSRRHVFADRFLILSLIFVSLLVCISFYVDETDMVYYSLMCYIFIPVTSNTMLRLLFLQSATVTGVALLLFVATLMIKPELPLPVQLTALALVVGCSAMTLWASYRNDHDERAAFLYLTREQVRAERSRRHADALRELSTLDSLTSIANRRGFDERFDGLVERARDAGQSVAVMMIDIDHFKAFNDHYGHIRGDACLRGVAQTLAGQLRSPDDLIARVGGEEFAIVAPGLTRDEAPAFLRRLHRAVDTLAIPHEGVDAPEARARAHVTVSIGCAVTEPGGALDGPLVLAVADQALYEAKRAGRDRWHMAETAAATV